MMQRRAIVISFVCFGLCSRFVVVADDEQKPVLATASPIRQFGLSEFRLTADGLTERPLCFSADGKLLAGTNGRELRVWIFPEGKLEHDFSEHVKTDCIGFAKEGQNLLAFDFRDKSVHQFDLQKGISRARVVLEEVAGEKTFEDYTFSYGGRWIAAVGRHSHANIWDTSTGKHIARFKIVGGHLILNDSSKELVVWGTFIDRYNIETGEHLGRCKVYGRFSGLVANSSGSLFAGYSVENEAIAFLDPVKNELVGGKIPLAEVKGWPLEEVALSADGRRLVSWINQGEWTFDRKMAVFDTATGKLLSSFKAPDVYFFYQPVISPDGEFVFPSGQRSVFHPVATATGETFCRTPDHVLEVHELAFTLDSKKLIVGSREKYQAWDVETGDAGAVYERWYYHDPLAAAINNDEVLISGMRGRGMRLHDVSTGAVLKKFADEETGFVSAFQLSEDRKSFTVVMRERESQWVQRTDIETGQTLDEWQVPQDKSKGQAVLQNVYHRYAFHGLALGGSRLIRFEKVRPVRRLPLGVIDFGQIDLLLEDWTDQSVTNRFTIPADGRFQFADAGDGKIFAGVVTDSIYPSESHDLGWGFTYLLVWDASANKEVLRVKRQRKEFFSAFTAVAISRDGKVAATASQRDMIELWDVETGKLLQQLDGINDVAVLRFNDSASLLASGHLDGRVLLWNTSTALKHVVGRGAE